MEFWKLESPRRDNDYQDSFINGQIDHTYSLPRVECKTCGYLMGDGTVLPYKCPVGLRERFADPAEVSIDEFNVLAKKVKVAIQKKGLSPSLVQPGCCLQPSFLDIPSKPTADFLWPPVTALVSQRIWQKLKSLCLQDVAFAEVTLRKVGKKSAKLAPPIPSTGEPEDIINEVPISKFPKASPRYFELCVYGKSLPPPGRELLSVCPNCGDKTFKWTRRGKLSMTKSMWAGHEMFMLETTGYILVTDKLKDKLLELRPTNIEFTRFPST
jgi:hypothetical protein